MAVVNKVEKKSKIAYNDAIKFQILTHCYLNNIKVSDADLECLTLLGIWGPQDLTAFCTKVFDNEIFKSQQTVRNAISKAEKKKLILKEGRSKKKVSIHPSLNIVTTGNILLNYQFLAVEK